MTLRLEEQGRDAKAGRGFVKSPKEAWRECCVRRCICQSERSSGLTCTKRSNTSPRQVEVKKEQVRRGGWIRQAGLEYVIKRRFLFGQRGASAGLR